MKTSLRISANLAVSSLLLVSQVMAQQSDSADAEVVRAKIERLENADIKSKSKTVQDIYRRTLLRLYDEYLLALHKDIADLKKIQAAAQSDPQGEISLQISKFSIELSLTEEKLKTIRRDVQVASSGDGVTATPDARPPKTTESPEISENDSLRSKFLISDARRTTPPIAAPALSMISPANAVRANAEASAGNVKLCGQIKPASLVEILALVQSNPALKNTQSVMKDNLRLKSSWLGHKCEDPNPDAAADVGIKENSGTQKDEVIKVLRALLDELSVLDKDGTTKKTSPAFYISRDTIKREILLLNGFIGNAIVHVERKDGNKEKFTPLTDKDGNYSVEVPSGTYSVSTEADSDNTMRTIEIKQGDEGVRLDIPIEDRPVSLLARAIVGYEQAGAAATKHDQNYFFDLFVSKSFPFKQSIDPDFGEKLRTWVDFRFASVPQSGNATIGDLSTGFATQVSSLKVKDAARVFEFMGGIEYRIAGNSGLLPSFDRQTKQKFSMSFIAGAGITTPTNSLESITTFRVTPGAPGLPPEAVGKEFVAFVQSDRDRFFRQYYAGFRMQTFFFNLFNMPLQRFPAQMDIAIGQNEFVTGGKLKGPVVRIDGYFPLPYNRLKFINVFGTALLRPGHPTTGIPLVLQPAPEGTIVPGPNVALIALPQPSRDYYRVGFGIDLISLIQKWGGQQ
jgi:hypothetical protein